MRILAGAVMVVTAIAGATVQAAAVSSNADQALEEQLSSLRYDPGPVDGSFDDDTGYAVTAFQKVHGMARSGEASPDVRTAVAAAAAANHRPNPMVPGGGSNRVEIDLDRQVLFLYEGDSLVKILPVSSGSGERFCSGGYCRNAVTNTGSFSVYRKGHGWEYGPLGALYNPQYFDGGIAIHGSTSVPAEPASHGCVRIPMDAAEWFPDHVSLGTPVYVLSGGSTGDAPTAPAPAVTKTAMSAPPAATPAPPTVAPPAARAGPLLNVGATLQALVGTVFGHR